MATDFTYGGKQILSSGPFKPNGIDMPNDARTRVETYADIASIPNPYVGLKITVKVDETNNNKMTDYIVKSLTANSEGVADSVIDEVVRYVDYLGVKDNSITLNKLNGDLISNKYVIENSKRAWTDVKFILDGEYSNCEIKAEFICTPVETKKVAIQMSNQNTNAIQFQAGVTKKYEVSASLTAPVNYFRLCCVDGAPTNLDGVYEKIKIWVDGERKGVTDIVVNGGSYRKIEEEVDFLATQKFVEEKTSDINLNQFNTDIFGNEYRIEMDTGKWLRIYFNFYTTIKNGTIRVRGIVNLDNDYNMKILDNAITCKGGVDTFIDVSKEVTESIDYVAIMTPDGMNYNYTGTYKDFIITVDDKIIPYTVTPTPITTVYPKPNFAVNKDYVKEALDKLKINISNEYMERFNLYPLDSNVINPPSDFLNGAIVNIEIDGISNEDYKKGLFIRRLSNSYSWATIADIDVCCGDETDKIFSSQLANYSGKVTMDNTCTYVFKAINRHIGTLKITIDFSKITANTNTLYTKEQTLLSREVIKNVKGLNETITKLPFVNNLYVVQGSKRKQSVPIFIDYLYNGSKDKILFENGEDRTYIREAVGYPNSQSVNIQNTKETLKFKSDTLNVEDITFNKISIAENTENGDIRLLIIGDSVTAGAITEKQYWAVANELFAKEDIDRNRTSKVMFLGSNNVRKETVEYNGKTKDIKSCACGISSWSLNHWLTDSSSHFVYDNNGTPVFSILKWIERYRTHLDDGTKLELGDSRLGTEITSSNIDNIQCCTPNIVYINSTHNGGSIEEHEQMIEIIQREIPGCKIIVGSPMPLTGTWHKEKYVGKDWLDNGVIIGPNYSWRGGYGTSRIESLNHYTQRERENKDNTFYFMPQCVTMPTVESLEYDLVDCGVKMMKQPTKVNQLPKEHPGTLTHKIWGYELYALLKYISGIEQGVTNNFNEVPLFN